MQFFFWIKQEYSLCFPLRLMQRLPPFANTGPHISKNKLIQIEREACNHQMCGVCPDHWCFQEMQRPRPLILLEPKLCFESCLYGDTWNSWWLVGYVSNFQASSKERYESISLLIWTLYVNDASMQLILLPIHKHSTAHSKHPSSHPWFSTELSVSTVPRYSPLMLTGTHSRQVIVQLLQSPWSPYLLSVLIFFT